MAITANAQGKKFTFPDGTSQEDMGAAIDEFFSGQQAPEQAQIPASQQEQPQLSEEQHQAIREEFPIGGEFGGRKAPTSGEGARQRKIDLETLRLTDPQLAA